MKESSFYFLFFLLLFVFPKGTFAQTDSLPLRIDRLGWQDLILKVKEPGQQEVVSASRTPRSLEDIPFTIYVVTKEEIFRNGYVTLVDALRSIPGIRVSQPGSALDGETFVMRGLYGNSYAKILINGVPVKPIVTNGMPLGAQLPIRQAERIEIIFGPAAAVYGADASAGVINIILKESEKPIYTRADLGLGENGYTDLNVSFGGKIGKDKRILKFFIYGSNTQFNHRKTIYDLDSLYRPSNYAYGDNSYLANPNFSSQASVENALLQHLSKMIGVNLNYRALSFSFDRMFRREYSAIGLNPVAYSYANPQNTVGETISRFQFGFRKDYDKWGFSTQLTILRYVLDPQSSYTYVNNNVSRFLNRTLVDSISDPVKRQELREEIHTTFFSGSRFSSANSVDSYLEGIFYFRPNPTLELTGGITLSGYGGNPLNNYISRQTVDGGTNSQPFNTALTGEGNLGTFLQGYLSLKKLNIIAGIRYDWTEFFYNNVNPRFGILYKLNPKISLRGTFALAFKIPPSFTQTNSYLLNPGDLTSFRNNALTRFLQEEQTFTYELGLRYKRDKNLYADVSMYLAETANFISYNYGQEDKVNIFGNSIYLGYVNDRSSISRIYGLQARVTLQDLDRGYQPRIVFNVDVSDGLEILPFDNQRIGRVRMQPNLLGQTELSFNPINKVFIHINNIFATNWASRFVQPNGTPNIVDGYYTLDILARMALNNNFQIYVKINNIFNEQYGGIGASGFIDDLLYNPQPLRTARLGLSYSMN